MGAFASRDALRAGDEEGRVGGARGRAESRSGAILDGSRRGQVRGRRVHIFLPAGPFFSLLRPGENGRGASGARLSLHPHVMLRRGRLGLDAAGGLSCYGSVQAHRALKRWVNEEREATRGTPPFFRRISCSL